jgi:DNA-binding NarL/FixJ family response regulator
MNIPLNHKTNDRPGDRLVALQWRFDRSSQFRIDLERFGIIVAATLSEGDDCAEVAALKGCDVLLVERHLPDRNESGTTSDFQAQFEVLVAAARSSGVGICVVIREESESVRELLDLGADSIAFVDQSPALLAVAVFTAHTGALTRRLLTK